MIESSRSISWWTASPIAWMYGISRAMSRLLLGVDVVDGPLGRREGAVEPELDGLVDLLPRGLGDLVGLLGGQRALGDEPRAEARNRVAALRGLVLLDVAEDRDRLVLRVVERDAGRGDDVPVRA